MHERGQASVLVLASSHMARDASTDAWRREIVGSVVIGSAKVPQVGLQVGKNHLSPWSLTNSEFQPVGHTMHPIFKR